MNKTPLLLALIASLSLGGCASLVPDRTDVAPSIPAQWPAAAGQGRPTDAAELGWRDFFTDPRLQQVIEQALANNRDLRVAVLNVERARGQYRIQRADRVPALNVQGQMERSGGDMPVSEQFTAGLGVTEFELDLFGRVRNLSEAALQQYFAIAANRRNAQLSLVAETATAWLTFGADSELLRISEATLASHEDSLRLAQARFERGGSSALELAQTRTLVETARTDAARLRGQLQQDRNALALLIGGPVDEALLPAGHHGRRAYPAGRQCQHRCGTRCVFSQHTADRHAGQQFGRVVRPVRQRHTGLEFPADDQPADLPGRQAAGGTGSGERGP